MHVVGLDESIIYSDYCVSFLKNVWCAYITLANVLKVLHTLYLYLNIPPSL